MVLAVFENFGAVRLQAGLKASLAEAHAEDRAGELRKRIEAAPRLKVSQTDVPIKLPKGQSLGMVSSVAFERRTGLLWILQRGKGVAPVLAVDRNGNVVHAFGEGMFSVPHAIRLAPDGKVWTVDAGTSKVMEFSPEGKLLLAMDVSAKAASSEGSFAGATDVAFARGHVFVADGYANARVVEYTLAGQKVREWGGRGSAPGQFSLPHCIAAIDDLLYVADRENGRIQVFDLQGKFVREFDELGRVYAVQGGDRGQLWVSTSPLDRAPGSAGWLLRLEAASGRITGYVPVTDAPALHTVEVDADGEPMTDVGNRVVFFRREW